MKLIKHTGIVLFLLGLAVFTGSMFMSRFTLTDDVLKNTVKDENHLNILRPRLESMLNKTYATSFGFVHDFKKIFQEINDEFKAKQEWDKVIYTNYTFALTKNSSHGFLHEHLGLLMFLSFGLFIIGPLMFIVPKLHEGPPGIRNNNIFTNPATSAKSVGILAFIYFFSFYMFMYYWPEYITGWITLADPVKEFITQKENDSQWFLYGFLYTIAVVVMGIRMYIKYRHSKYQIARTTSVIFFQIVLAFLIPELLARFDKPGMNFYNMWPLDYYFFFDWNIQSKLAAGNLGIFMIGWGIALFTIGAPVFVYFFGKRWYCSWVCGCGGLAETLGDPYRQLSSKSLLSWKAERWIIHSVLVSVTIMTIVVAYHTYTVINPDVEVQSSFLGIDAFWIRDLYGLFIGSIFAGVIGTGFYPIFGNRVWCRFGCPLAAYLGFIQRFKSKFRITTNGGQCISCGNCSTYCEMGIDVRWYAQRGQDIVRSSCVGCGICSAVCPRGVLNLENGPADTRKEAPISLINGKVEMKDTY